MNRPPAFRPPPWYANPDLVPPALERADRLEIFGYKPSALAYRPEIPGADIQQAWWDACPLPATLVVLMEDLCKTIPIFLRTMATDKPDMSPHIRRLSTTISIMVNLLSTRGRLMECRLRLLQELEERYIETKKMAKELTENLDLCGKRRVGQALLNKIRETQKPPKKPVLAETKRTTPQAKSPVTKCLIALQFFTEQLTATIRKIVNNQDADSQAADLAKVAADFIRLAKSLPFYNKTKRANFLARGGKSAAPEASNKDTTEPGSNNGSSNGNATGSTAAPQPDDDDGVDEAAADEQALMRALEAARKKVMDTECELINIENRAEKIYNDTVQELYQPFNISSPFCGMWDLKIGQKVNYGKREKDPQRLAAEAEFVQCLANPQFLREMLRWLPDPNFINFLHYLKYWFDRRYSLLLTYPIALQTLQLLVNPFTCEMLVEDPHALREVELSVQRQWAMGSEVVIQSRIPKEQREAERNNTVTLPPMLMGAPLPPVNDSLPLDTLSGPPKPNESLTEASMYSGASFFKAANSKTDFKEFMHVYQSLPLEKESLWKFEEVLPPCGPIHVKGIEAPIDPVLLDNRLPTPPRQRKDDRSDEEPVDDRRQIPNRHSSQKKSSGPSRTSRRPNFEEQPQQFQGLINDGGPGGSMPPMPQQYMGRPGMPPPGYGMMPGMMGGPPPGYGMMPPQGMPPEHLHPPPGRGSSPSRRSPGERNRPSPGPKDSKRVKRLSVDGKWRSSIRSDLIVEVQNDGALVQFNGQKMPNEIKWDDRIKRYQWGEWKGDEAMNSDNRVIKWVNDKQMSVIWTRE